MRLLNWRTRALIEEEQYSDLTAILHDFSKFKLTPNRRTYHLLLSGHVKNHDLHRAKECLQQMYAANCPPDASTYALLATIFRPFGYDMQIYSQATEAIPKLDSGEFSTNVLNSLLQIHLDSCNPSEDTLDLISMFDLPSLKSAVASSLGIEIAPKDTDTVEERPTNSLPHDRPSVKPNSETFCILLNNAASRKDVAAAKMYLEIMSATNVEPTAATVTSLLHVLYATSHDAAATQLLSDICGPQTSDMFQRLSDSQAKLPLPISVTGILPDTKMFNAFLKANLNSKGLAQWALILRIMHAHGLEPNDTTVNILISYLEKVEHARPRELLRILQTFSVIGLKLGGRHFHGVIRSIINREKRKIQGIGWKSQAYRLSQPNPPPLMIKDFSQISEHLDPLAGFQLATHRRHGALAQPLIRQLSERGVRSDAALFALRIRYEGVVKGDLDSARNMFHALLSRGIRPTAYHFAALMEGHTYAGDILGAEEVMQAAVESGIAPNVVMFTILISGHARKGKPYLALRTFQRMLSLGIKPDVPSIDAVANAFFAAGARAMARRVLLSLWPYISPCPPELLGAPLRDLSRRFRELHEANAYSSEPFPKSQRTMVRRRTARLIRQWLALDGSRRGRSH
ncbi:hypothetical protein ONZ45_g1865 [Pleurotus djamor]|nr:hypothetical protein ONZ45_g1865 [Pleurotus djamor]